MLEIKKDLATLADPEWGRRIRALARSAPNLNVFSAGYVIRHPDAWQITEAGMRFLTHLELGTLDQMEPEVAEDFTVEPFSDRPQRTYQQHRPETSTDRRSVFRRMRQLASNWMAKNYK